MALSSTSTDAEVWAAYDDNASYDANGSAAQAQGFIVACRFLLRRMPKMMSKSGDQITNNPEFYESQMRSAQAWLASNPGAGVRAGGVGYFSFNFSRD